jgi:hypothetical protein
MKIKNKNRNTGKLENWKKTKKEKVLEQCRAAVG